MSIVLNSQSPAQTNTDTAIGIKTAQKALSQQELEGQMAINLIETATMPSAPAPAASPVGNIGNNINTHV